MAPSNDAVAFREVLHAARSLVVLAGAGLSAASGIPTYRGSGGLWKSNDPTRLATLDAFCSNPGLVWMFYKDRIAQCRNATPNAAHRILASLFYPRCSKTHLEPLSCPAFDDDYVVPESGLIPVEDLPKCGGREWAGSNRYGRCGGLLRPGVVWFGEVPEQQGGIARVFNRADVLLVVGTSALVYPAAGYVKTVKNNGGKVAVFNIEASPQDEDADFVFLGPCEGTLPAMLGAIGEL
ncbi:hypothetical protein OPQ81_011058 [Rhizoctonia solani]|nr:hypothetical protein OPQ81_011058 [Rhizoctonia solani]